MYLASTQVNYLAKATMESMASLTSIFSFAIGD